MAQTIEPTGRGDTGGAVSSVARFLERFGYLVRRQSPAASMESMRFDGELEEAIARYQRLHSLPDTGLLDAETLRLMNTPRCGVADITGETMLASLAGPGSGWGKRDITFTADLVHNVPALGAAAVRNEIVNAFSVWAMAGALRFTEAFPADIFLAFHRGDHGDGHPSLAFDGTPGGSLGHAFPPPHPRLAGQVHLDADERWSTVLPVSGSADLPTLLLHEIGHALGLEHDTQDRSAVMHERFEVGGDRRSLSLSDVTAIRAVYPT
jgi:hypothetical protein